MRDASTSGPPRRASATIQSATVSSWSALTGRPPPARARPRSSFWRSKRSRRPSRLTTSRFGASTRSWVVSRPSHSPHSRRRRTPSGIGRVSITWVESAKQNGQCTHGILLPLVPDSSPEHYILCALRELYVVVGEVWELAGPGRLAHQALQAAGREQVEEAPRAVRRRGEVDDARLDRGEAVGSHRVLLAVQRHRE